MHRGIAAACAASVAALLLSSCASKGPAAAAPAPAPVAKSAPDAKKARSAASGFRAVNRNGEQLYCKRELMTGSRTHTTETCLTEAQMQAQRNNTDDFMRRVQDMSNGKPTTDGSGGQFNNVMTSSGRTN